MTLRTTLSLCAITLALAPAEASAKKGKSTTEESATEAPAAPAAITETGIKAFDDVYMKAKDIHTSLDTAKAQIADSKAQMLAALGAGQDVTLGNALKGLQEKAEGKLTVALEGSVPKLSAAEGVPDEVKATVDAFNASLSTLGETMATLQGLPAQADALVTEAQSFPGKINPSLLSDNNLKVTQLGSVTKAVGANTKAVGQTPTRIEAVTAEATALVTEVTGAFGS